MSSVILFSCIRIEIEGGEEVPVLDGSALGWALAIQQAGQRPALDLETGQEVAKMVLRPLVPVAVSTGGSKLWDAVMRFVFVQTVMCGVLVVISLFEVQCLHLRFMALGNYWACC